MKHLIALTLLLNGCGGPEKTPGKPSSTVPDKATNPGPAKPVETSQVAKISYSIALTAAQRPTCGAANADQLIYVKDLGQFQVCDGSAWSPIDITGPQGAAGKDGASGAKGDQGVAGPKGDTGAAGVSGPKGDVGSTGSTGGVGPQGPAGPVTIAPTNEWSDPLGLTWLVASTGTHVQAVAVCSSGWRIPTAVEVQAAILHNIASITFTHPVDMWTTAPNPNPLAPNQFAFITISSAATNYDSETNPRGIYCVK